MAGQFEALKDLDLTREEVERIGTALKDKEFRKLLCDYVDEIKDPENQKIYQQEITELEKERGYDVTFINPTAGYVIKTSVDGSKKAFINVCANDNINKPTSSPMMQEGTKGLQWSLPHSLTPPREDVDKKGSRCVVYDVVFHPDTLYLARNNKAFLNMVNKTACEAVESNFTVNLDCKNLKFPKLQYKGLTHPAMIRKSSGTQPEKLHPHEEEVMNKLYESLPKVVEQKSPKKYKVKKDDESLSKYTTPVYAIKHRSHVEFDEYTEHKTAKLHSATPKELVVEINLPLLRSADDIELDVTEKTIELSSEKPSKYKLHLALPYNVNQDNGNAKFDKDTKKLIITLPVKRKEFLDLSRDDSGVESDHGSPTTNNPTELSIIGSVLKESDFRTNGFLHSNTHYILPEHTTNIFANTLAFTLQVKNVDESSLSKKVTSNSVHIKFATVSSGFYSVDYAFYARFPEHILQESSMQIEVWDNNVIVQIPFDTCDLTSYLTGLNECNLEEKLIDEPIVWNNILESKETTPKPVNNEKSKTAKRSKNVVIEEVKIEENEFKKPISKAIDISGAVSESSGDELSCSYSPSKCKGILKRLSCSRSSVSRGISESSIDDVLWASSFENCHTSLDSVIPEDGEVSSSLKKTVRFNDVVLKQLYRSNSSILGQKKKNQRKTRNKKRAQERRHSESELSELDEQRERDLKTTMEDDNKEGSPTSDVNEEEEDEEDEENPHENNIFDLDI